jgi:DNA-directed RNA polymerase specialized sigma24 family protein
MQGETSGARFETTCWTAIARVQRAEDDLGRLLQDYWNPIYAYLRRSGQDTHAAAELTQAFITDVMIGRKLVERADPRRGRFRSYILNALRNFLVDAHRRAERRARESDGLDLDAIPVEAEPHEGWAPDEAFDRHWAAVIVGRALEIVERSCHEDGMETHWSAFEQRILVPVRTGSSPPTVGEVARRLGESEPSRVSSMIQVVKRRFRRAFREVVAETVETPDELETEITELRRYLGLTS